MSGLILLADGATAAQDLSIFDPASPPAESIRSLSVLVLAITGFIFIAVEGILVYSIVRFRRRAAAGTSFPPRERERVAARDRAAPGLREQADRDRLDGGAGAGGLCPGARLGPHPLGGERSAAAASRGGQYALRHGGRPPVVVGVHLRPLQRPGAGLHDGQRTAYPSQREGRTAACLPDPEVRGRVPQLLGTPVGRQDRPDPGSHQQHVVPDRQARPVPRAVRRVLRHAARQHAHSGRRRFPERLRGAGWPTSGSRPWSTPTCGPGGPPFSASRASTVIGCAALPRGAAMRRT